VHLPVRQFLGQAQHRGLEATEAEVIGEIEAPVPGREDAPLGESESAAGSPGFAARLDPPRPPWVSPAQQRADFVEASPAAVSMAAAQAGCRPHPIDADQFGVAAAGPTGRG